MIDWSIVLSVIVGILIIQSLPFVIYGLLYVVFVALPLSLGFVYVKFREIVLGQKLFVVHQVNGDDYWSVWVDPDEVEYTVIDESESWRDGIFVQSAEVMTNRPESGTIGSKIMSKMKEITTFGRGDNDE